MVMLIEGLGFCVDNRYACPYSAVEEALGCAPACIET